MNKFTTIKDEVLKKQVNSIILNVAFQEEDQLSSLESIERNLVELEEVLKLMLMGDVKVLKDDVIETTNNLLKHQITQLKQQITHQNKLKEVALNEIKAQTPFIEELRANYKVLENGYITYNEQYFKDRINLYAVSGLTNEVTKDDLEAGKLRGSKVYEWAKNIFN